MSFVDASVIVAIINAESGFEELEKRLAANEGPLFVSPLVRFEATVALARAIAGKSQSSQKAIGAARELVDDFVRAVNAAELPISTEIGNGALDVADRYGKFVGHAANLNFGDCFAYACAKANSLSLIYKGDDFVKTDLG
ncbi:ribonuclease VapC30 [Variibacter gotjawalensis]|uniref:Ribonuclease VapC n=1 Tax=Variibacter gotjawalensis TaxID=1333996 RepID=A0A0S3PV24_9BRAD|nr:type II toxin-antitoxin system VapC family toxin [Variibacter gotjawalensis]NIK49990.1 ribonuclease VapC [Variibacter gotjawalensis]RZS45989.1 ribonuclease VapC [Variibacter gotjawalensis]BAT59664.1 ribonuclease VapC30 [Variibacter gotjawalensis]